MKILIIQQRYGIGDLIIFLPYIHAISKKFKVKVSLLVKESSKASELLSNDENIDEIILLDKNFNLLEREFSYLTSEALLGFLENR